MAYVVNLANAKSLIGQLVGDGQFVSFIHKIIIIPASSLWKQGEKVRGNVAIIPGTVIATFDPGGHYGNHKDGRSHAAVYLGQNAIGIQVLDQWKGNTV